jgi:iron complex outermembrane recepter protein
MSWKKRARCGASLPAAAMSVALLSAADTAAVAQQAKTGELSPLEVQQSATAAKPEKTAEAETDKTASVAKSQDDLEPVIADDALPSDEAAVDSRNPYAIVTPGTRSGSLTVPTAAEALADINQTPGGVEIVPAEEYKDNSPSVTLKDALDYVPGVFVQPKWGEDSRLSIRGSGLSRNFHGRGVTLLTDGVIPITTADGSSDFQEIDPTAYSYIEVYKGANALQYGANSLGGAINFVSPTGYDSDLFGARVDIGSFGFAKTSISSGAVSGNTDYFIIGTWQRADGFREHSEGESFRGSGNIGFKVTEDLETRFYFNANDVKQKIPGAVTRRVALESPTTPNPTNVALDYERNLESLRVANVTAYRVQPGTVLEFGGFYMDRHLDHPIFRVIDNQNDEYGGFGRLVDDNIYNGYRNRLVAGISIHNGNVRARQYRNVAGERGALFSDAEQTSDNTTAYAENSFFVVPSFAVVAGIQYNDVEREQQRISGAAASGQATYDFWSPKGGFIWQPAKEWQVFGNISRSGEAPTFSEISLAGAATTSLQVQRAMTYEIGTRGNFPAFRWDLSLYRSNIENEFQCRTNLGPGGVVIADGTCTQINLDKTIHQGVEVGGAARLYSGLFEPGPRADEVWLHVAYTLNDFRFDDDPRWGGNQLPGAPRHYLHAELLYKHPSGLYAGPNVEWSPEAFYVDSANTVKTTAYALLNAKVGFDNGGGWSAYLEGRNLTDEAYIASASIATLANPLTSALFEPGTGRAVYGGVQYRW